MTTDKTYDVGNAVTETADVSQLELVDPSRVKVLRGVRVFDVGQGDCIGLLDQNEEVCCYIDYGGLGDHPDQFSPEDTAKRLPVSYRDGLVSIVLTHWDKDHYWSANKKNPAAQACEWLVPRQMVSPQAVFFAQSLKNAKCWPEDKHTLSARIGIGRRYHLEIRKCGPFSIRRQNEDRNRTGLAITLLHWNRKKLERVVLLPGDCPFHLIPERPDAPICALVAYHHGSKAHWTRATDQVLSQRHEEIAMTYSYGKNGYGHPEREKYKPNWDANARTTADARSKGQHFADMLW